MTDLHTRLVAAAQSLDDAEAEIQQLKHRLATKQARLDELLRSAKIWRAWYDGSTMPHVVNLVEKIDLIASYEANDD